MPIFLNSMARACLLMGYVKSAIKPPQIVDKYVPLLKSLSQAITTGVAEMRLKRRESQKLAAKPPIRRLSSLTCQPRSVERPAMAAASSLSGASPAAAMARSPGPPDR